MVSPTEIPEHLIDIERVIASKNPALLKVVPGFLIRYLKRITHQEAINDYIYRNREKFGLDFIEVILKEFGADISSKTSGQADKRTSGQELTSGQADKRTSGQELTGGQADKQTSRQVNDTESKTRNPKPETRNPKPETRNPKPKTRNPKPETRNPKPETRNLKPETFDFLSTGRFIIASNHPLGGLDGMALMQAVGRVRKDLVFPVNDILMNVPGLQPLFIPINKHGKNTDNARIIDETFASDKIVLYFPAGLVSRKQKGGVIRDLEWKKTFISKARRYHRDVVPVHISGKNSDFFYNLSNWRRRLGIKANLEMLYLVDEMVKQKDKPIRITFGRPIPWQTFDKSRTDSEWAAWVKERVYEMGEG